MTTPPFDVAVQLFIDGAWVDITTDVRFSQALMIGRGKTDEASQTQPSNLSLTLNDSDGRYWPENPTGPYYGKIGRNTPIQVLRDGQTRFTGEVSSWSGNWNITATIATVVIEAAGILRRIGTGSAPVMSGHKAYLLATSPVTYWPLDDGTEADRGWPIKGTYMGSSIHREFGYAVFSFAEGTLGSHLAPTLRINDTSPLAGSDLLVGYCKGNTASPQNDIAIDFVYRLDSEVIGGNNMPNWQFSLLVQRFGAVASFDDWRLNFRPDGTNDDIELMVAEAGWYFDPATSLANSAALDALTDGLLHHVRLQLSESAGNTAYEVWVDGVSVISGTSSVTYASSVPYQMRISYNRLTNAEDLMAIGHVIVWEGAGNIPDVVETSSIAHGFAGEAAGRRFERLCAEVDVPFLGFGDLDDTLAMGVQFEDYFENQITEIEDTDRGLIYEPRHTFALGYRTRASLYNQDPLATLNFNALDLAPPFEPVLDDTNIRNDVFAQRREGASFQATQETGPLSVQDPPDGIGRYKDEVPVNVETDEDLPALAGWLLALGTVNEPRYRRVSVDLRANTDPDLLTAEIGYPIQIIDTERLNIYDPINLLVLGYSETLSPFEHRITFNCVPYSPFQVMELDLSTTWADPGDDTTLNEDMTTTETGMDITSAGFLWTTSGGDLPVSIMVGGEEMTVTAISGASNPQTMTVTRSVNGVVKTHATGAVVHLKRPGRLAL